MKFTSLAVLALGTLLATTSLAHAYPKQGWYIGGAAGAVIQQDSEPKSAGVENKLEFDPGFAISGSAGFGFENQFRPEFEINYRRNEVDKVRGFGAGSGRGDYDQIGFMGNLFYDFDTHTGLTPYLGVGIGGALDRANRAGNVFGGDRLDDEDFKFAYQGIAGVAYELSERLDLTMDYRYFRTVDPHFSTVANGSPNVEDASHNFMVGLRYTFGIPQPLPEPVPMRTAPRPVQVVQPAPQPLPPRPVVMAPPPVAAPEVPETYIVFFDFDKYYLTTEAKETISRAADAFKRGGNARVEVTGHTDTRGASSYNLRLSQRRARAVKDYMVAAGIPAGEIKTRGAGETELMVPTANGVREAKNRRAEIVLK